MIENINQIVTILLTIVVGLITFFKWKFTYWSKKNIPSIEPSIPFGSTENPFHGKTALTVTIKHFYSEFKRLKTRHGGFYSLTKPIYMPIDPELVKNIMQKDFTHFVDRGMLYYDEEADPISAFLFAIGGEKWRNLRTKLTPTFTTGKMKMMFNTLLKCSEPMKGKMDELTEHKNTIDIKEIVARFTTDVIGSCAFGLECNSFGSEEAEFRKYGKKIFQRNKLEFVKFMIVQNLPKIAHLFKMRFFPKQVSDFFLGVVNDTVKYREDNNVKRNDLLQLLIEMKNTLSMNEIGAQAFGFFIAGFETSSTTMSFCLFELARNPDIQEKMRSEINDILKKHNNEITYDGLAEMKYMGQVIDETLRIYPPIALITRVCVNDYKVPETDVVIDKGTSVYIPTLGLHHDPEYFPDPEKFNPERFSEENKKEIHPFTYLPFGEGPRVCIELEERHQVQMKHLMQLTISGLLLYVLWKFLLGLRFGVMQIKVGLSVLLKNYRFCLGSKTKLPIKINPRVLIYMAENTIWLNSEKI